jgi:uncharacterized protein
MSTGKNPNKPRASNAQAVSSGSGAGRKNRVGKTAGLTRRRAPASGGRVVAVLSVIVVLLFLVVIAIPRDPTTRISSAPIHASEYLSTHPPVADDWTAVNPLEVPTPTDPAPLSVPTLSARPEREPMVQPERTVDSPAPDSITPSPVAALPTPGRRGTLYLVIDDAGYNLRELERFLAFPLPLTIAVLPHLPWSTAAALRTTRAGKEVILHLPMEAESGADPGPGAIMVGQDEAQIRRRLHEALSSVPGATGANNHMGSRATSDRKVMDIVISELSSRGLFFVDSRTTAQTVARPAALAAGIRFTERHVFLDNERDHESIRSALAEAMRVAADRGYAVMIGHVMVDELAEVLMEVYPSIVEQGFEFGFLSDLMAASVAYERTGN